MPVQLQLEVMIDMQKKDSDPLVFRITGRWFESLRSQYFDGNSRERVAYDTKEYETGTPRLQNLLV